MGSSGRWCFLLPILAVGAAEGQPLEYVGTFVDSRLEVERPTRLAVSPDGGQVYVTAFGSLRVHARDPVSGLLSRVQSRFEDVVDQGRAVIVSPDGENVYASGDFNNQVVSYARDVDAGLLTRIDTASEGRLWNMVVSPDGSHVYGAQGSIVSGGSFELLAYARDAGDGRLTQLGEFVDPGNTLGVAISTDGDFVYTASETFVSAFARDAGTGIPTLLASYEDGMAGVDGLGGATDLIVSSDNAHLYVAGRVDDAIAVFARDTVSGLLTFVEAQFDQSGGVDGLDSPRSLVLSPGGDHLYAASLNSSSVAVFERDATTGSLTFVEALFDGVEVPAGLELAHAVAVSPDGSHVYACGRTGNTVVTLERDAGTGELTFPTAQLEPQGLEGLLGATHVTVSPSGEHLYVLGATSRGLELGVFGIAAETGVLSQIAVEGPFESGGHDVEISPDGRHLYLTTSTSQGELLVIYSRDAVSGEIQQLAQIASPDDVDFGESPFLRLSADGGFLYVVAANLESSFRSRGHLGNNGVALFARDATTGMLTFVESLGFAADTSGFASSPDSAHVYVPVESSPQEIIAFERDEANGLLTEIEREPLACCSDPRSPMVSADGAHLYLRQGAEILRFDRDVGGLLDPATSTPIVDPSGALSGSVDGRFLFLKRVSELEVFIRDAASGSLTTTQLVTQDVDGVHGISSSGQLLASPDGTFVFVTDQREDAVTVLRTDQLFADGFESGDTSRWSVAVP